MIYISGGMAELRLWISYPAFLAWRICGVFGILGMVNIRCIRHSWHGEYSYISEAFPPSNHSHPTYQSPSNHSHPSSQFYPPSSPKLLATRQAFHDSLCPSSPFCELFIHPVLELSKLIFYRSSWSLYRIGALGAHITSELSKLISYRSSRSSCHIGAFEARILSELSGARIYR